VKGEERINLTRTGLRITPNAPTTVYKRKHISQQNPKEDLPTAAGLLYTAQIQEDKSNSVFCDEAHSSYDCLSAQMMELSDKQKILRKRFFCLNLGHDRKNVKQNNGVYFMGEGM
jgi:hypothetical protein